jgi:hypothetical protein
MKSFVKINGPKPSGALEILALPEPNRFWGESFSFHSSDKQIAWIRNGSGLLAHIQEGR